VNNAVALPEISMRRLQSDSQIRQACENAYLDCRPMLECHGVANLGWATRTGPAGPKGHVSRPEMRLANAHMSAARLCDGGWGPSADGSLVGKRRRQAQVIWQSPFETCPLSASAAGQRRCRGPRLRSQRVHGRGRVH
jgi:hypothetical protein